MLTFAAYVGANSLLKSIITFLLLCFCCWKHKKDTILQTPFIWDIQSLTGLLHIVLVAKLWLDNHCWGRGLVNSQMAFKIYYTVATQADMCVCVCVWLYICAHVYLSTVQVVTLCEMSAVCMFQSPLGSSLTCRVKYLSGEDPEPPVTQWRRRRRGSTPSWGTDNFLGGWGRSVVIKRSEWQG